MGSLGETPRPLHFSRTARYTAPMTTPHDLRSTDLNGSVAFVTGAASGIGRASARLLAAAGARVALADRDLDGAQALAAELGDNAGAFAIDVADRGSIESAPADAERALGVPDVLLNPART